jgi:hypothetical protein
MKKILSLTLAVFLIAACLLTLASCGAASEVVGTYEMSSISGAITYAGQTVTIDEDYFDYYRITLKKDGTYKGESKAADSTAKIEQEGTWEYDEETGKLTVKSTEDGTTVIEEMTWKEGVITYNAELSEGGVKLKMRLKLEKQ